VKQAILATVVAVVKKHSDSVAVLLRSEELGETTRVVYTGLNREHSFKTSESSLEVICSGDPKAKAGDKVPVIVDLEPLFKPTLHLNRQTRPTLFVGSDNQVPCPATLCRFTSHQSSKPGTS
jgi:hypothetical protein